MVKIPWIGLAMFTQMLKVFKKFVFDLVIISLIRSISKGSGYKLIVQIPQ